MNRLRSLLAVLLLVVCPSVSLAKLQSGNFHVNLTLQEANSVSVFKQCSFIVVQIVLAQPDEGPDRSKTSLVVLLVCSI